MAETIDLGHDLPLLSPVCTYCKHFRIESSVDISIEEPTGDCAAFPEGIPIEIWSGENDHKKQFQGDNSIQFEEAEK